MVKLVCYNIEYCEGMKGHWYEYLKFWRVFFPPKGLDKKIIKELKKIKPDILALVEVDKGSFRSKKNRVLFFKEKLNMTSFVKKVKYPINGWLKLMHYIPILNKQTNAILSKYKFSNVKYHYLSNGVKRVAIEVTINCPKKVTLLLGHLACGYKTRKKQLEELAEIISSIKNPVIFMGDFNTFKGKKELKNLMKKTGLKDKAKLDRPHLTFPSWHPMKRLDYVLVSPEIKVKKYKVLKYKFSDHMPLFIEFTIK